MGLVDVLDGWMGRAYGLIGCMGRVYGFMGWMDG
jgi:hypothetical protein